MSGLAFLDTNVLLLAAGMHPLEARETEIANSIVATGDCALSVQVLGEFFVQATRTSRGFCLDRADAAAFVRLWTKFPVQANDARVLGVALELAQRTNYHYYDCSIIAAALALRCDVLLTRDLQHGHVIDGLTIENPFKR